MLAGQAVHNQTIPYNYVLGTYFHCITHCLTYTGLLSANIFQGFQNPTPAGITFY